MKMHSIFVWAVVLSEKRIASYFSWHCGVAGCSLCKFEFNQRLFSI